MSAIALDYHYRRTLKETERLHWQTRLYVLRKYWHTEKQQARLVTPYERKHEALNRRLKEIANFVEELYFKYQSQRQLHLLTVQQFRLELDEHFFGVPRISTEGDFIKWVDEFIRQYQRDPLHAYRTAQIFKTARQHLVAFELHRGHGVSLEDWDINLFREFVGFLRSQSTAKSDNTIHKIIFSGVKKFLIEAAAAGRTNNTRFSTVTPRRLGVSKTAADDVYLSIPEIKQLYSASMPPNVANVRDCFVACCFLGLRISDWQRVDAAHIIARDGRQLFEIAATEKTGQRVIIPAHPVVLEILNRHNGRLPLPRSFDPKIVMTVNRPLKEAARLAGLTERTTRTRRQGKVVEEVADKSVFVSSKTARESFFSNMLSAGIPRADAKKFMGHAEGDVSEGYDRRSLEEIALRYADHPFFTTW